MAYETEEESETYHWLVIFRKGGMVYPYRSRTVPEMVLVVKKHHDKRGIYPHGMWVVVDDEVQKVVIT